MNIKIDQNIELKAISLDHANEIYNLVEENRAHLKLWLPFVENVHSVQFIENYIRGSIQRNLDGVEHAFTIFDRKKCVGRIGIYRIDRANKIGEFGYWLSKDYQGKGIITKSCQALIQLAFSSLDLNRIELKCATNNQKSNQIAVKLNFTLEAILRDAEYLHEKFIDLNLYSLLKKEYISPNI